MQDNKEQTDFTGGLTAFWDDHKIMLHEKEVMLTMKEFDLLQLLAKHPQRIFSKDELYEHIWSQLDAEGLHTVTVHIKSLRKKLEDQVKSTKFIKQELGKQYHV